MQRQINDYFGDLYRAANKLVLYREILNDSIISKAVQMFYELTEDNDDTNRAEAFFYELCAELFRAGIVKIQGLNLWEVYLLKLIAEQENPFTLGTEKSVAVEPVLLHAAIHDAEILRKLLDVKWDYINNDCKMFMNKIADTADGQNSNHLEELKDVLYCVDTAQQRAKKMGEFYFKNGSGKFGLYHAFKWNNEGGLIEVACPDKISFENLIGYEAQKATLINNTEAFLCGRAANNILLFGDRGTGKSSSVKALINKYHDTKLRLIEVTKHQLIHFNVILNAIRNRNYRFIIFIDDLSFEDFETEYKYLKAIIEGGIEAKPDNVIIYATSNRRHLIKETWADRDKNLGDVHMSDTMQEKLSLVDRFGITITYTTPDQDDYLKIVSGLAAQNNINISESELREKALHWAMWHNGRSGRTAKQFISDLLGKRE